MTDYAELRAAMDAVKPGDGDTMLAYRLASGPEVIRALLAERDAMKDALEVAIAQMEYDAAKIDGEWGGCRSIDELERDGELPEAIVLARAALAQGQEEV